MTGRTIRDTTVAVVGGAGFLGSHLVRYLLRKRNCRVIVIDNLLSGRREFLPRGAEFIHHDITGSEEYLRNIFRQYEVQYVFNYAAEPYIPDSFKRPLRVFDINATGALKVIHAATEAGCKAILQVSSAELYGDNGSGEPATGKLDESAPVRPHSSYGVAKAAIDWMVQVRWKEAQVPVILLRQFNCVGERETHPYVIPEIITQLNRSDTVYLGNNSTRDFQYAGDAVRMAVRLLETGQLGEIYNMGSSESIRIYDLARLIGDVMLIDGVELQTDPSRVRPWEIWHLQSDNTKLLSAIGETDQDGKPWHIPLREALERTFDDFVQNGYRWIWE